eukprot:1538101-Rhodomonas_salina.1
MPLSTDAPTAAIQNGFPAKLTATLVCERQRQAYTPPAERSIATHTTQMSTPVQAREVSTRCRPDQSTHAHT